MIRQVKVHAIDDEAGLRTDGATTQVEIVLEIPLAMKIAIFRLLDHSICIVLERIYESSLESRSGKFEGIEPKSVKVSDSIILTIPGLSYVRAT